MTACRSCKVDILWAHTVPLGKRIPLDETPVPHDTPGALVVVERSGNLYAYALLDLVDRMVIRDDCDAEQADRRIREEYHAHTSHFATCPDADSHRRRR